MENNVEKNLTVCLLSILILSGCPATTQIPPVKTYAEATKIVEASGPLVDPKVENREHLKEGVSKPVKKGEPSPVDGAALDEDKVKKYVAIKAERDRLHKELQISRKTAAVNKIIRESTIDNLRAQAAARSTWWDKNKGVVGLTIGIAVGMGIVLGVMYGLTKGNGLTVNSNVVPKSNTALIRW